MKIRIFKYFTQLLMIIKNVAYSNAVNPHLLLSCLHSINPQNYNVNMCKHVLNLLFAASAKQQKISCVNNLFASIVINFFSREKLL